MPDLDKLNRQQAIRKLVATESISTQEQLVLRLAEEGFAVTQSQASRDANELGIVKVGGHYVLPLVAKGSIMAIKSAVPAGPNLIVLRTDIGAAQRVAYEIDALGMAEIVGTVAGDDTLFLAVAGPPEQAIVLKVLGGHL